MAREIDDIEEVDADSPPSSPVAGMRLKDFKKSQAKARNPKPAKRRTSGLLPDEVVPVKRTRLSAPPKAPAKPQAPQAAKVPEKLKNGLDFIQIRKLRALGKELTREGKLPRDQMGSPKGTTLGSPTFTSSTTRRTSSASRFQFQEPGADLLLEEDVLNLPLCTEVVEDSDDDEGVEFLDGPTEDDHGDNLEGPTTEDPAIVTSTSKEAEKSATNEPKEASKVADKSHVASQAVKGVCPIDKESIVFDALPKGWQWGLSKTLRDGRLFFYFLDTKKKSHWKHPVSKERHSLEPTDKLLANSRPRPAPVAVEAEENETPTEGTAGPSGVPSHGLPSHGSQTAASTLLTNNSDVRTNPMAHSGAAALLGSPEIHPTIQTAAATLLGSKFTPEVEFGSPMFSPSNSMTSPVQSPLGRPSWGSPPAVLDSLQIPPMGSPPPIGMPPPAHFQPSGPASYQSPPLQPNHVPGIANSTSAHLTNGPIPQSVPKVFQQQGQGNAPWQVPPGPMHAAAPMQPMHVQPMHVPMPMQRA